VVSELCICNVEWTKEKKHGKKWNVMVSMETNVEHCEVKHDDDPVRLSDQMKVILSKSNCIKNKEKLHEACTHCYVII